MRAWVGDCRYGYSSVVVLEEDKVNFPFRAFSPVVNLEY